MKEMEYSKIVDDVKMLLSLSDEDYYRILEELGLRDCYILTKSKKVKNKTQFRRKLKLVKN